MDNGLREQITYTVVNYLGEFIYFDYERGTYSVSKDDCHAEKFDTIEKAKTWGKDILERKGHLEGWKKWIPHDIVEKRVTFRNIDGF